MANVNKGSTGNVKIPGALHSSADDNIVAYSGDIYDDVKGENQREINIDIENRVTENKQLIDAKVVEAGGVPWDITPTKDSTNGITSGGVYKHTVDTDLIDTINESTEVTDGTIHKLKKEDSTIYPVTTSDAVIDKANNKTLSEGLSTIRNDVDNIEERLDVAEPKITDNRTDIDRIDKEVDDVQTRLQDFEGYQIIENDEFVSAIVDADELVLFGLKREKGELYAPHGIPEETRAWLEDLEKRNDEEHKGLHELIKTIQNTDNEIKEVLEETTEKVDTLRKDFDNVGHLHFFESSDYLLAAEDADSNLLFAIKREEGDTYIPKGIPNDVQKLFDSVGHLEYFEDKNYIFAAEDINGNLLFGFLRKNGKLDIKREMLPDELQKWINEVEAKINKIVIKTENVENEEFIKFTTDKNGVIVSGIRTSGEVYIPKGLPEEQKPINTKVEKRLSKVEITSTSNKEKVDTLRKDFDNVGHLTFFENDEYILAAEDTNGNLIVAFKRKDGTQYAHGITEDVQKLFDSVGHLHYFENDKYILAVEDIEGNVLFGFLRANGKLDIQRNSLPQWLLDELDGLQEKFNSIADLNAINVENNEFIEFTTDKDGLIVRGTKTNGESYIPKGLPEEQKPINTKVDKRLTALENTLENFEGGTGDWSEATSLKLPMPTVLARVDIEGGMPTSKYVQVKATLTFRDVHGNSFTKPIMISLQGNISSRFDKKNFSFDLYNSINDDESFDLQFDGWVPQDGYHLKAYISDFWKIRSLCVYRHAEQISQYRPYFNRRPWSSLIGAANQTVEEALKGGVGDVAGEVNDFALGHPDGFPVMLYYNGIPWGLYTWNLKKNKDNYHITKNDAEGKQLFFGDWMIGVFQRYNTEYWRISNYNLQTVGDIEPWDENKDYEVGDVCYYEETIDFEVGGKTSKVTIRRAFLCRTAYKHDVVDTSYNTYRPSYVMWKELEVRNPKTTICKETDGTFQYYDYDSPSDYSVTGYYERTHEIISENDLTQKQATALGFSKKEYTRSIAARKTIDAYSYVCPILDTTLTAQNLEDWGFSTEAEAKKAIFAEHHDVDFNLDFFLVYNDCNYYDSITHNTLYTMYDGKKLFAHLYDTDISMGMSTTYVNSFPAVSSSVLTEGRAFSMYLWTYYSTEIKSRWKELRDAGIISAEAMEKLVWQMVESVGIEAYEEEARLWSQPSYRSAVYWYMAAGSLQTLTDEDGLYYHGYDESLNTEKDGAETWVSGTSYIVGDIANYKGHSYTCTAAHTSTDALTPDKCYTCGSPDSGGVYDSPRRIIEWFKKRVEYLDSKFGYEK